MRTLTLTLAFVLASASVARADETTPPRAPEERAPHGYLGGGIGAFGGDSGGLLLDALALLRAGVLAFGVDAQVGSALVSSQSSFGAAVGVFAPTSRRFELGLVGIGGAHAYSRFGAGLLSDDPGISATFGNLGARGVLAVTFGRGSARFALGLHPFVDFDLGHETRTYSYSSKSWFGDNVTTETATHTVGGMRTGAIVALGASL